MKNNNEIYAMSDKDVDVPVQPTGCITDLENRVRSLNAELEAVKDSRDTLRLQLAASKDKVTDLEARQRDVLQRLDKMETIISKNLT